MLFRQDQIGVIPELVMRLLEIRKASSDVVENANLKLILASIYGILGFRSSPFYNLQCASSVCALGRMACDVARASIITLSQNLKIDHDIICRNTDSVSFQLRSKDKPKKVYAKFVKHWGRLNEMIQQKMGSQLFDFKFES